MLSAQLRYASRTSPRSFNGTGASLHFISARAILVNCFAARNTVENKLYKASWAVNASLKFEFSNLILFLLH